MTPQVLPPDRPEAPNSGQRPFFRSLLLGFKVYLFSSVIVVIGVVFGRTSLSDKEPEVSGGDVVSAFSNWDGKWYARIVEQGYHYHRLKPSTVAFFPAYPLLSRTAATTFGLPTVVALMAVTHLCLAAAFVLLAAYLRQREGAGPPHLAVFTLLIFGFFPTTMFFRMAYSESLFVLTVLLFLYATQQRWPLGLIALLVGLATACRAPGVGLLPPFALHVWQRCPSWRRWLLSLLYLLPIACWGLAAYVIYQWLAFGEPLAFVKTQAAWRLRPRAPIADKLEALLTLEPIWLTFVASSEGHWARFDPDAFPVFSLWFANPIYFVFAAALTVLGWRKRSLSPVEAVTGGCLLLIPYLVSSYEMYMAGGARFAAVIVPVYLVLGELLCRANRLVIVGLLAVSGFLLGAYSALFAARHAFF